jgi:hypothetical protein
MRRWVDRLVEGKAMICTKLKERRPRYDANLILGEASASSDPRLLDGTDGQRSLSSLSLRVPSHFWDATSYRPQRHGNRRPSTANHAHAD